MVWEDGGYGLISWKQENEFGRHTDLAFGNPDWVQLAEAFGWRGVRVERSADLAGALEDGFAVRAADAGRRPHRLPGEPAPHRAPRQDRRDHLIRPSCAVGPRAANSHRTTGDDDAEVARGPEGRGPRLRQGDLRDALRRPGPGRRAGDGHRLAGQLVDGVRPVPRRLRPRLRRLRLLPQPRPGAGPEAAGARPDPGRLGLRVPVRLQPALQGGPGRRPHRRAGRRHPPLAGGRLLLAPRAGRAGLHRRAGAPARPGARRRLRPS